MLHPGKRIPLELDFKGARTYLHGTDMVDALTKLAPDLTNISLRIQKIAKQPLAAVRLPDAIADRRDMVAIMTALDNDNKIEIGLVETENAKPPGRYEFDENDVVAAVEIDSANLTAQMYWNGRYSFIEQLVAVHKALLYKCFATETVHWYFTRLDMRQIPQSFRILGLTVTQALGTKLVRSSIEIDGQNMGNIYFSGVAQ